MTSSTKAASGKARKIRVTQTRSVIGRTAHFKKIIKTLGLGCIGNSREFTIDPSNPGHKALQGTIERVGHIVQVTEL